MKLKSNPSKTLLTIVTGFMVVYMVTSLKWVLLTATILGIVGVLSEYASKKIEWLWFKLTWILSLIVPNILLSIVFFLFLFPISLLAKLFSKSNALQLKNIESTWIEVNKKFSKESLQNPW
jgi:hypothetical protein